MNLFWWEQRFEIRMADCGREDTGGTGEVALRIVVKRLEQRSEVVGRKVSVDYLHRLWAGPGTDGFDGYPHGGHGIAALRRAVVDDENRFFANLDAAGRLLPERQGASDPNRLQRRVPVIEATTFHRSSCGRWVAGHDSLLTVLTLEIGLRRKPRSISSRNYIKRD